MLLLNEMTWIFSTSLHAILIFNSFNEEKNKSYSGKLMHISIRGLQLNFYTYYGTFLMFRFIYGSMAYNPRYLVPLFQIKCPEQYIIHPLSNIKVK